MMNKIISFVVVIIVLSFFGFSFNYYISDRNVNTVKNNRENWLKEELAIITSKSTYDLNPDDSWKRLKIKSLNKFI